MLQDKNILITGVSKGLGLEIARSVLKAGGHVFGISRTKTPQLEKLLEEYSDKIVWLPYDLSDVDSIQKVVFKDYIGSNIRLDGLVNNAALAYDDIVTNLNIGKLEQMYRINVFAAFNLTKYSIRQMLLHNVKGSIIHLSSISVHTGYKGLAMYASTKGALEAFSKNTAREWGEKGIRSNCLVAGFMETEMSATLTNDQKNRIYNRTSLKQSTDVLSVADTVVFLLSSGANSITGQNIHVDSGTI